MDAGGNTSTSSAVSGIVVGPRARYAGLAILLTWAYSLWFLASPIPGIYHASDTLVYSRFSSILASAVVPMLIVWRLGRTGRMKVNPTLIWTMASLSFAASLAPPLLGTAMPFPWPIYLGAVTTGTCGAFLWIMWGQRLADQAADFAIQHIAPIYGGFLLASVLVTSLTPPAVRPMIVACYPLLSGLLLHLNVRLQNESRAPRLLPRSTTEDARRPILTAAIVSMVTAFACYLLMMIIHTDELAPSTNLYSWGVASGAVLILGYAGLRVYSERRGRNFSSFAWLLLPAIAASAIYLVSPPAQIGAFMLALATSSLLELLLVRFMGVLMLHGYLSPVVAFAVSRSAIRLGIGAAILLSAALVRDPGIAFSTVPPTLAVLIVVLAGLIITMMRQEFAIQVITHSPEDISDLDAMVDSVAAEFQLSEREREIVGLIGRGYSANAVADKLVISPHTVNTHVQHIYAKLGIHKRAELIAYLHRDTNV
jgi:DNA-binding CsgD family transcriptional regulator